mgnify:FL=1
MKKILIVVMIAIFGIISCGNKTETNKNTKTLNI